MRLEESFYLSRFPVTNNQFKEFMEDDGYNREEFWSKDGLAWLGENSEPKYWHSGRWNNPNQPVVGVSFWEAEACCHWAGGRLPREREWEAAVEPALLAQDV